MELSKNIYIQKYMEIQKKIIKKYAISGNMKKYVKVSKNKKKYAKCAQKKAKYAHKKWARKIGKIC